MVSWQDLLLLQGGTLATSPEICIWWYGKCFLSLSFFFLGRNEVLGDKRKTARKRKPLACKDFLFKKEDEIKVISNTLAIKMYVPAQMEPLP